MEEELKKLLDKANSLLKKDISHSELGPQNDFGEANNFKNIIVEKCIQILNELKNLVNVLPKIVFLNYTTVINNQLDRINGEIENIDKIISQGIHNADYPNRRNARLNEIKQLETGYVKALYDIYSSIRFEMLYDDLKNDRELQLTVNDYKEKLSDLKKDYEESKKILGNLRELSFVKSLKESAGTFEKLRLNHSNYEKRWFISFILCSLIVVGIVVYIIFFANFTYQNVPDSIALLVKKIIALGVPIIGMRVSLKKYNLERNLKIIYDHRATVLEQYKYFENAIGDDKEAKNKFRLEIAKYIFSDPITGYIQDNTSPDVSVNPIVSVAEKIFTK